MEETRLIKFRAWDGNKMISGDDDCDYGGNGPSAESEWCSMTSLAQMYERKGWTLMQFTGLKDKNGKEIYEDDLFGKMDGDTDRPGEYEIHARVYFDEDLSAFCIDDQRGGWEYLSDYLLKPGNEREIIGNIYEDSELLVTK